MVSRDPTATITVTHLLLNRQSKARDRPAYHTIRVGGQAVKHINECELQIATGEVRTWQGSHQPYRSYPQEGQVLTLFKSELRDAVLTSERTDVTLRRSVGAG